MFKAGHHSIGSIFPIVVYNQLKLIQVNIQLRVQISNNSS
jgi:hypothetical protein